MLITGGNRGIGYELALELAEEDAWDIVLACRRVEEGQKAKKQIESLHAKAIIDVVYLDIGKPESI